jgi:hypothetical protein
MLIKFSLLINTFLDLNLDLFLKILKIMIENSLFHFSVEMILLKFSLLPIKIQESGVELSKKEKNSEKKMEIIILNKISKSEIPLPSMYTNSNL